MLYGSRSARIIAFVALMCAILVPATQASASRASRLAETRREIAATRARMRSVIRSDREILAALVEINGRLGYHETLLRAAQRRLSTIDIQMRSGRRRLAALLRASTIRSAAISARAVSLYIQGPIDPMNSPTTSIADYVGRAGALDFVAQYDRRMLEDLSTIRYRTGQESAALSSERTAQADLRDEIAGRVEVVQGLANIKRDAHSRLRSQLDDLRAELAAEERAKARILGIFRARGSVYTGGNGRLGFAWPIRGNITSPYGYRWGRLHAGIDIDCNTGDPIGASKAGRVIASEYDNSGYGNMIIIDHGNGYATLYGHLSRRYVGQGESVKQHRLIGACGSTGHSTGDHLHFGLYLNGNATNPRPYLP